MADVMQFAGVLPESFIKRVRVDGECWVWEGLIDGTRGFLSYQGKRTYAHFLAWHLINGQPHKATLVKCCDTRLCCNPSHFAEALVDCPPLPVQEGKRYAWIAGLEGYCCCDDGTVWTFCWHRNNRDVHSYAPFPRQMKTFKEKNGYLSVNFEQRERKQTRHVHALVMESFGGERPEGMQVCHNDGNKENNAFVNLRWDTPVNNQADRHRHGTHICGERQHLAKLTAADVPEIRRRAASGETYVDIAKDYHVWPATVRAVVVGITWKHI